MSQKPDLLQVDKNADGKWQVLIASDDWLSCTSEADARLMSRASVYEHDYIHAIRTDLDFASELEQLAELFDKYRMGFGALSFRDFANQVRKNKTANH